MLKQGAVYLVGAGPGDPGLVTIKGLEWLKRCDVVIYDYLSADGLLDYVKRDCRKIYVGKQAGRHSMKQEEINLLLIQEALSGNLVVRLKGGDPFVFGRGGEEMEALQAAGIPCEAVPGVTSAVAALECAGIPVTHRGVSQSFHVMTGHTADGFSQLPGDFKEFAALEGTLVFLMGLNNLEVIVAGLIAAGKPPDFPAAVVESGTMVGQKVVRGTLMDLIHKVDEAGICSPAVIVAGKAASLDFSSTAGGPLKGIRFGLAGTDGFTGRLAEKLEAYGAQTRVMARLETVISKQENILADLYRKLPEFDWLVFTSANGVRLFIKELLNRGKDIRQLGHMKLAAVGSGTAGALSEYGLRVDYLPRVYSTAALAEGLAELAGGQARILIPRAAGGSPELPQILTERKIKFWDVPFYDTVLSEVVTEAGKLDYLVFGSGSGVMACLGSNSGIFNQESLAGIKIACIGDITAQMVKQCGYKADVTAATYSIDGLVTAVCQDAVLIT